MLTLWKQNKSVPRAVASGDEDLCSSIGCLCGVQGLREAADRVAAQRKRQSEKK